VKFLKNKRYYITLFILLLLAWASVNVLQALFSDVIRDEAYYFFYSTNLSWGYFDHPPLVALMVRISSFFFDNELSVRFITIVLQLFTLVILWNLLDHDKPTGKDVLSFFGISFSVVMFTVYGFVTTPDSPLLFFTAFFLFSYRKYLSDSKWLNILLLSLSMAGLIYSKYQGGLVIALVIFSNLKLLKDYRFWIAGLLAIILLSPHIYWQAENGFPSFVYHTIGRAKSFKMSYLLEYLPNQAASFNPFVFVGAMYILFKYKAKDFFDRSLWFVSLGMILFFGIMTFRGHSQPQWTIASSIPFIILIYRYRHKDSFINKLLLRGVYPSIILLIIIRVILISDSFPIQLEFHNQKQWADKLALKSKGVPLIFQDGYQKPSLYRFYTGNNATTVNSVYYRQNQYDMFHFNEQFIGNPAFIVEGREDSLIYSDNLVLTSFLHIEGDMPYNLPKENSIPVNLSIRNTGSKSIRLDQDAFPVTLHMIITGSGKRFSIPFEGYSLPDYALSDKAFKVNATISIPDSIPQGTYRSIYSIKCGPFREGFNGHPFSLEIKKPV
jgi:hypothetical protein